MRVGIIGAGAAGLTAAHELAKHGHSAVVYERAPFLGGQASTFDIGGARLERGYHHLFTSDTDILDLVQEIGLGDRMRWIESKVGTLHDGKIYNFVTPMDLLRFTPLSFFNRLRLGTATLMVRRQKDWRGLEGTTAADWLRSKAGKSAYEVFWGPMLRGKFGERHFSEVGMAWVWGKMQTRFASRGRSMSKEMLGYPIGSFGEIFDTLAENIVERGAEVHLSTSVRSIVAEDGRATGLSVQRTPASRVSPEPSGGRGNQAEPKRIPPNPPFAKGGTEQEGETFEPFDAVVATAPSYDMPRLLPGLPDEYLARLTGVNYMAAVLLILVLDRPLSHIYWLNVADRSIPFVGVIEQTNLIGPEPLRWEATSSTCQTIWTPKTGFMRWSTTSYWTSTCPTCGRSTRSSTPRGSRPATTIAWMRHSPSSAPTTPNASPTTGRRSRVSTWPTRPRCTPRTVAQTTACGWAAMSRGW